MIALSVNVNKIALLRNSRGGSRPDLIDLARVALHAGAAGITVHPRPDQRHIRASDVPLLARMLREEFPQAELNIEGNPFAAANDGGYPGLVALVAAVRPAQVTLVPDTDSQLTSDHGWDLPTDSERVRPLVDEFHDLGARVSLFMDPEPEAIAAVPATGADRIELYTGPYAAAWAEDGHAGGPVATASLARFTAAARFAETLGLGINAGHDLDLDNLIGLRGLPGLTEVSIGHALVTDALELGLFGTVRRYCRVLNG